MGLMLLGFVPPDCPTPLGVADHLRIETGPLDAIAIPLQQGLDPGTEAGTLALAQSQHAVLCQYAEVGDVVPVALGSVFSGADRIVNHVQAKFAELNDLASRLAGRVEYALALDLAHHTAAPEPARSGKEHLLQKARARRQRETEGAERQSFLTRLADIVRSEAEAHRIVAPQGPARLARLDFLIARDRLDACKERLAREIEQAKRLNVTLCLTGPYPAFSFLNGALNDS